MFYQNCRPWDIIFLSATGDGYDFYSHGIIACYTVSHVIWLCYRTIIYDFYSSGIIGVIVHGHVINNYISHTKQMTLLIYSRNYFKLKLKLAETHIFIYYCFFNIIIHTRLISSKNVTTAYYRKNKFRKLIVSLILLIT